MEDVKTLPAGAYPVVASAHNEKTHSTDQSHKCRYFFVTTSVLFLLIALLGFVPSYQDMYAGEFPIHWITHIHGGLMTTWLLVFIAQSALAATRKYKFHRQLGLASVVLGVLMLISMVIVSARALLANNLAVDHFMFDVLIGQFYVMFLFCVCFVWGVAVRKQSALHKRLLFMATLVLIQAAIDRTHWLPWLYYDIVVRFVYLNSFLVALMVYDFTTTKHILRITLIGCLMFLATQTIVVLLWGNASWHIFWFNFINQFRR